jgi:hypothetical protein
MRQRDPTRRQVSGIPDEEAGIPDEETPAGTTPPDGGKWFGFLVVLVRANAIGVETR